MDFKIADNLKAAKQVESLGSTASRMIGMNHAPTLLAVQQIIQASLVENTGLSTEVIDRRAVMPAYAQSPNMSCELHN